MFIKTLVHTFKKIKTYCSYFRAYSHTDFMPLLKMKKKINLTVGRFSGHSGSSGFNVDYLKSRNILDTVSSIFNEDL